MSLLKLRRASSFKGDHFGTAVTGDFRAINTTSFEVVLIACYDFSKFTHLVRS